MQVKTKYVIIALVIALAGVYLLGRYAGHRRTETTLSSVIQGLQDEIVSYKYQLGALIKTATEKDQMILSQKQAIETALIEKEELKKLNLKRANEVTYLKVMLNILEDSLSHSGTVVIVEDCDSADYSYPAIRLPFHFWENDSNYNLYGGITTDGVMDVNLNVPVEIDLWTGIDKDTKEYKAVVTSNNPVVQITGIRSAKFDIPTRKKFGIGLSAGYGIGNNGLTPFIGVSANFNLIEF